MQPGAGFVLLIFIGSAIVYACNAFRDGAWGKAAILACETVALTGVLVWSLRS